MGFFPLKKEDGEGGVRRIGNKREPCFVAQEDGHFSGTKYLDPDLASSAVHPTIL